MQPLDHDAVKLTYGTRAVPPAELAGVTPLARAPQAGDLIVAEVLATGRHDKIEDRAGLTTTIFPGSRFVGALGNRYATDQYEGYVPREPVEECDLLSVGGVCGAVASRFDGFPAPTRLRVVGAVCDRQGRPLNSRRFGLPPGDGASGPGGRGGGEVILVVGSAMNSGKTTTVGTLARALTAAGRRVAAAKVTGTAAGRDVRYYGDCGARPVLDFTDAGHPSTFLLDPRELLALAAALIARLRAAGPDYIVVEIADGIFQRETRLLLESADFRAGVDHAFFAATDSLSAECGARRLREYGLPLCAVAGTVTRSPLATREAEEATGVPCLSIGRMLAGEVLPLLQGARRPGRARPVATLPRTAGLYAFDGAVAALPDR